MGSEFWVSRTQVGSGLAFSWVHTGPSLAVLAFDQTELLFSVPRTAAASLWALGSGLWTRGGARAQDHSRRSPGECCWRLTSSSLFVVG